MIILDGLQLPEGLLWADEFTGNAPVRSSVSHSLGGAQFIQKLVSISDQKITLQGGINHGFMRRDLLLQIKALANAGSTQTLVMHDGTVFTIDFRYSEGAIEGELIKLKQEPVAADLYRNVIIRMRVL